MSQPANVISHWHQLIEQFQTSSVEFYSSLEKAVEMRAVPDAHWRPVEHKEGGLASAKRQYLRMHRGKYAFDICAAPFGTGFFISWWFTEPPLAYGLLYTLGIFLCLMICFPIAYSIGLGIGTVLGGIIFGAVLGFGCSAFGVPVLVWFLGNLVRRGDIKGESTILAMPIVGWIYERIFAPSTFYTMDTALMFQDAVHNAVLEVIDGMTVSKGMQALSDSERKPIMKQFAASA